MYLFCYFKIYVASKPYRMEFFLKKRIFASFYYKVFKLKQNTNVGGNKKIKYFLYYFWFPIANTMY